MPPKRFHFQETPQKKSKVEEEEKLPSVPLIQGLPTLTFIDTMVLDKKWQILKKPNWWKKIDDPQIVSRWRSETGKDNLDYLEWALREIREFAVPRVQLPIVPAEVERTYKAHNLIPADLRTDLIKQLAVLENVPEDEKDWHPGSDGKVLNLVHPSLFCAVHGVTRLSAKSQRQLKWNEFLGAHDAVFEISATPAEKYVPQAYESEFEITSSSEKFQWLPSEFYVDEAGKVRIDSYINNLHPEHFGELYNTIAQIFEKFVPLFENVLTDLGRIEQWPIRGANTQIPWDEVMENRKNRRARKQLRHQRKKELGHKKESEGNENENFDKDQSDDESENENENDENMDENKDQNEDENKDENKDENMDEDENKEENMDENKDENMDEDENKEENMDENKDQNEDENKDENKDEWLSLDEKIERGMIEDLPSEESSDLLYDPADSQAKSLWTESDIERAEEGATEKYLEPYTAQQYVPSPSDFEDQRAFELYYRPNLRPFEEFAREYRESVRPFSLRGRSLQVIFKAANILLKPGESYPGGKWHVEGMKNEKICATGIYYYDVANIKGSSLGFRMNAQDFGECGQDPPHLETLYAMHGDKLCQSLMSVGIEEGLCLTFPNAYQHCISPFTLKDPKKPGHRKVIVFFLIDPTAPPITSTAHVPPQQASWMKGELFKSKSQGGVLSHFLPKDIIGEISEFTSDWPMSLEQAKKFREQLMKERSVYTSTLTSKVFERVCNLCEH